MSLHMSTHMSLRISKHMSLHISTRDICPPMPQGDKVSELKLMHRQQSFNISIDQAIDAALDLSVQTCA